MILTSPSLAHGAEIPVRHTCDGADLSPALEWAEVPLEAKSLVLLVEDPDTRPRSFVHWLVVNIPPRVTGFPEGVRLADLAAGARMGTNDFCTLGYRGPCPPRGSRHRYFHRLFALDVVLSDVDPATRDDVEAAMSGHVIARAELMVTYARP